MASKVLVLLGIFLSSLDESVVTPGRICRRLDFPILMIKILGELVRPTTLRLRKLIRTYQFQFLLICILDPFLDANRLDSSMDRERLLFSVW